MIRILLGIILSALLSISAYAQIDNAKVEKRFDQLEQQFQELNENYGAIQSEFQELRTRDNSIQRSINDLLNRSKKLSSRIDRLQNLLQANSNDVSNLERKLRKQEKELLYQIDKLQNLLQANSNDISKLNQQLRNQNEELSRQILETRKTTSQSVYKLDETLSKNTLYWSIAVLVGALLSIFAFVFLRKKVKDNQSSISERIARTRRELEQQAIRLDEKLIGIMETQMKIIQEERQSQPENQNGEQDHSLALKVADEIVRIEKNISRMDKEIKGLKQLIKAVERIKDNFAANGYEIVDMVGKSFDDGIKATANFIPDDNLNPGERIISRIIKPQVNYKGKMIQAAQIEVSQGG